MISAWKQIIDPTYATIVFSVPERYINMARSKFSDPDALSGNESWRSLFAALRLEGKE